MFTWLNMDISFNVHVAKHPLQEGEGVHGNLNSLLCMKQKISWNTARVQGTRWKGGTRSVRARKRRDRPIDRWMDNIQRRTCIVKFGYHGINKCDRLTPGVFFTFFSLNIFPHIIQEISKKIGCGKFCWKILVILWLAICCRKVLDNNHLPVHPAVFTYLRTYLGSYMVLPPTLRTQLFSQSRLRQPNCYCPMRAWEKF